LEQKTTHVFFFLGLRAKFKKIANQRQVENTNNR
jgi:hypothetical protein